MAGGWGWRGENGTTEAGEARGYVVSRRSLVSLTMFQLEMNLRWLRREAEMSTERQW